MKQIAGLKILVVDDRPDKAKSIEAVLSDLGEVILAHSGKDALRLLLCHEFAVVLLDVRMPGMDGFETAELIRQRQATESTPIIFITSYGDADISRGYSLGAVDYIVAPVVPEILRAKVSVLVELHRKTEEARQHAEERIHLMQEQMARATAEAARKAAEDAETRAAFLADATGLMAATLDSEQLLDGVARRAVPYLFEYLGIDLIRSSGNVEHVCAQSGIPKLAAETGLQSLNIGSTNEALKNGKSLYICEAGEASMRAMNLTEHQIAVISELAVKSLIVVPLAARGRTFGWLTLATTGAGRFLTLPDLVLAEDLGQRIAISMDNSRLYKEAQIANRMKDEFLAIVSHELRTPLTPILGWTSMLRKQKLESHEAKRGLEIIDRSVRAQVKIIEDLLDVSRIVTGKLHLKLKTFDPVPVVESCVESLRAAAEAKNISIAMNITGRCPALLGDDQRIQQIVWNLLSNAVKFTPPAGKVSVELSGSETAISLKVSDTGRGISAEFLPHVFERFRQADSTTTRAYGGLGLGLSIVRQLAELHGGGVSVESEGEGKGSTFVVTLPVRQQEVPTPGDSVQDVEVHSNLSGVRILVVDDEPDSRQIIGILLERQGAVVQEAGSTAGAMESLTRFDADIVISDIGMPVEDGYALVKKLRAHPVLRFRDIPAMALSAYVRPEDERRSIEAGFNKHLSKPAELETLTHAVQELLVRRRPGMLQDKLAVEPGRDS